MYLTRSAAAAIKAPEGRCQMKFILIPVIAVVLSLNAFAEEKPLSGKIISIDELSLVLKDGSVKKLKINTLRAHLYDRRTSISLTGLDDIGCGCGAGLVGRVIAPFTLKVQTDNETVLITVPAHRTHLYSQKSAYQIDVKDRELGHIVTDAEGSTANRDLVFAGHEKMKRRTRDVLSNMQESIVRGDYPMARYNYADALTDELFPADLKRIAELYESIPEEERPLKTYDIGINYFYVRELNKMFNTNFDMMTLPEYIAFLERFAVTLATSKRGADETYLYEIMKDVGVPEETRVDLLIKIVEVRLPHFISVGKEKITKGLKPNDYTDLQWDDTWAAKQALMHLRRTNNRGVKYLTDLVQKVVATEEPLKEFLIEALDLRRVVDP
jgi:hypothetical protein